MLVAAVGNSENMASINEHMSLTCNYVSQSQAFGHKVHEVEKCVREY